jgi:hypothetical protein
MSVIPALKNLRQKDSEFKAILGYTVRLCLKKQTTTGFKTDTYNNGTE